MISAKYPTNTHESYHAHVYFEQDTLEIALKLFDKIKDNFPYDVSDVYKKCIGPHPKWNYQVTFTKNDFNDFIPWLDSNRDGLTVFIHGISDDFLKDHTEGASWLGKEEKLNIDIFKEKKD